MKAQIEETMELELPAEIVERATELGILHQLVEAARQFALGERVRPFLWRRPRRQGEPIPPDGGLEWFEPGLLSPTRVVNQHFVPRFHLKRFADPNGRIQVHDVENGKLIGRAGAGKLAAEPGYNDVLIEEANLSIEPWFATLESYAAPVIDRLVLSPSILLQLTDEQENDLARFLIALRFRGPWFKDWSANLISDMASGVKEFARNATYRHYSKKVANELWNIWKDKPDHWWLKSPHSASDPAAVADMLHNTQRFANLLRSMRWRVGETSDLRLYTSDNPMTGHLSRVRPWWDPGMFTSFTYLVPLSSTVLLKVEPRPFRRVAWSGEKDLEEQTLEFPGIREVKNFSSWETSFVRHLVSRDAVSKLYGPGPVIPRVCSDRCLERVEQVREQIARAFKTTELDPPRMPL